MQMSSSHSHQQLQPNKRLQAVMEPVIPEISQLMAEFPGTLSLAQGMVSWHPPANVYLELQKALINPNQEINRYGPVQGDPALIEAIKQKLKHQNGLDLTGSTVLVTAGSNMAFRAIAEVLCDPNDEVILPLPYYFNHVMAIQMAGGVPIPVDAGVIPDPEQIAAAITPRTRAVVTVSPNNPSGVVFPRTVLIAINELCAKHGLLHISDEAYEDFVLGDEPHWSPGAQPGAGNHTISLYSFSKGYGMAGWRLGYMAAPGCWQKALAKVQDTVLICPPRLLQKAAVIALKDGPNWVQQQVRQLRPRHQLMQERFGEQKDRPWHFLHSPNGAFYGLLEVDCDLDGDSLMRQLIKRDRVATVGGRSFGFDRNRCVLRISVGMLEGEDLKQAFDRLEQGLTTAVQ